MKTSIISYYYTKIAFKNDIFDNDFDMIMILMIQSLLVQNVQTHFLENF